MEERPTKRRGPLLWLAAKNWRFCVAQAVLLSVLYFATFGPVCWWLSSVGVNGDRGWSIFHIAPRFYWPIGWTAVNCPEPLPASIRWYATLGFDWVFVPTDWSNRKCVELWRQSPPVSVATPSLKPIRRPPKPRLSVKPPAP